MENDKKELLLGPIRKKSILIIVNKGSINASIICLLCISLSSCILSMPYTMKTNGIMLCISICFISFILTLWTLKLLIKIAIKENIFDYSELVEKVFGKFASFLTQSILLIGTIETIICYNIIIINFTISMLEYFDVLQYFPKDLYNIKLIIGVVLILLQGPLCTWKKLSQLHILSEIGTVMIFYILLVSILEFPYYFKKNFQLNKISFIDLNANIFQTFCIFFYAFGIHSSFLNVAEELQNKEKKNVNKLANYSFYLLIFIFVSVMFIGYFSTLEQTNDIYINREGQTIFMIVGKIFYIICLICNIGLYYYMSKTDIQSLFSINKKILYDRLVYILFMSLLLIISLEFDNVILLLSFIGGTGQVYLTFIVPILMYVKSYKPKWKIMYYIVLIVISFIGASNTILSFINLFIQVFI